LTQLDINSDQRGLTQPRLSSLRPILLKRA